MKQREAMRPYSVLLPVAVTTNLPGAGNHGRNPRRPYCAVRRPFGVEMALTSSGSLGLTRGMDSFEQTGFANGDRQRGIRSPSRKNHDVARDELSGFGELVLPRHAGL